MKLYTGTLDHRRDLSSDVYEVDIELSEPLPFEGGQFVTIKIPSGDGKFLPRSYSIASSPRDEKLLTLCIKKVEGGPGTTFLYEAPIGTKLELLGPLGEFVFNPPKGKEVYFIATGTGIAPFMPMLSTLLKEYPNVNFHVVFGVRYTKDLFYRDIFQVYKRNHKNFDYELCVSREEGEFEGFKGRVTHCLAEMDFSSDAEFYICGNGSMVTDVMEFLQNEKAVEKEKIFVEKYNNI